MSPDRDTPVPPEGWDEHDRTLRIFWTSCDHDADAVVAWVENLREWSRSADRDQAGAAAEGLSAMRRAMRSSAREFLRRPGVLEDDRPLDVDAEAHLRWLETGEGSPWPPRRKTGPHR